MLKKALLRGALAFMGLTVALNAGAFQMDQAKIAISRALNSPTITVRYTGVSAALAELRINGTSYGTRTLDSGRAEGETNFTIDVSDLKQGDNEIEIRLFNKAGKLVSVERQLVYAEPQADEPVFIRTPTMGATVAGTVDIQVGFGKNLRNTYVSFFVNNQFKSMSNVAPYSFKWDTEREINGWHEIEAWIVDEQNHTLKTKKIKVFVNNPGGTTHRIIGTKNVDVTIKTPTVGGKAPKAPAKPAPKLPEMAVMHVDSGAKITSGATLKPTNLEKPVAMDSRIMTPAGTKLYADKVETPATTDVKAPVEPTDAKPALVKIEKGTRLNDVDTFDIALDGQPVKFDVQPRVVSGIPLTPFRHLFEQAGGEVNWDNNAKTVDAKGMGKEIFLKIGDIMARVNGVPFSLEMAPFIEKGRTMVPLSFIKDSLEVDVDYDKATGHVLISQAKKD